MATDVNTLIERVRGLTPEQRDTLAQYLDVLANETVCEPGRKIPFIDLEFCGMWRDREDMKDSAAWVRHIRANRWRR